MTNVDTKTSEAIIYWLQSCGGRPLGVSVAGLQRWWQRETRRRARNDLRNAIAILCQTASRNTFTYHLNAIFSNMPLYSTSTNTTFPRFSVQCYFYDDVWGVTIHSQETRSTPIPITASIR